MLVFKWERFLLGKLNIFREDINSLSWRRREVPITINKEAANKASKIKLKIIPPPEVTSMNVENPKGKEKK